MRRICIYQIRQTNKNAAGYIRQTLTALRPCCSKMIVVQSEPADESVAGVRYVCSLHAAFSLPWLSNAEEILLLGDEWMGPVRSIRPMLQAAEALRCDAWQLARNAPFWGLRPKAFKHAKVLAWAGQAGEPLQNVIQSLRLTTKVLYYSAELRSLTDDPALDKPKYLSETLGCPFFLHELFHRDYQDTVMHTLGHTAREYYRYLTGTLRWDAEPMWDFLLATCHMEDLYRSLHLTYVLPTRISDREAVQKHLQTHPLALMMHLYYDDLISQSLAYAKHFPPQTDVYITTDFTAKRAKIKRAFASLPVAQIRVFVIPNRGRDVSALLVGMKDVVDRYEYVCFYHDKKVLQTKPGSVGIGFADKIQENLMASPDFVCNVVQTFMDHPRLGLLTPPAPHHADYFFTLGTCWGVNFAGTHYLKEKLDIDVPMAENKRPIAPLGTCFWFRKHTLDKLYAADWTYKSFPAEPNPKDGTMLHAVERLYPFAVQAAGFYCAYCVSDRYAPVEYTSLHHYVRGFHRVLFQNGIMNYHRNMCRALSGRLHSPCSVRQLAAAALRSRKKRG